MVFSKYVGISLEAYKKYSSSQIYFPDGTVLISCFLHSSYQQLSVHFLLPILACHLFIVIVTSLDLVQSDVSLLSCVVVTHDSIREWNKGSR